MALFFTLVYVAVSLLSPSVLPDAIVALHVNIILGILAILACLIKFGASKIGSLPDTYLVVGLLFSVVCSIVFTSGLSPVADKVMEYIPIFIVFYFIVLGCRTVTQLTILVYVMLFVALYIFAHGAMADHAGEITSRYLEPEGALGNVIYRYKGLGVLSDPNDTAQFFITLIPLLFLRWKKGSHLPNFLFTILPACILATGEYFTHSRGGVIALVALTIFGFKDKLGVLKSSILAGCLFAAMMVLNVSGGRGMNDDDGGRVAAWSTGLEVFRAHPLFGVGIDRFPEYNDTGHTAHNSYVLCLAEIGLLGYACWMGAIVSNWSGLSQITRTEKKEKRSAIPDRYRGALEPNPAAALTLQEAHRASLAVAPLRGTALAAPPAFAKLAYEGGSTAAWTPPFAMPSASTPSALADSEADLVHAAKVLRVSFVGLLTAAFFLSRTFSMLFYILLGMSAAMRLIYRSRHPEMNTTLGPLFRKIALALAASVVFLYFFVRIRGIH